jgi:myosin heavy chain 6/7
MAIFPPHSYMILAPAIMQAESDPKVAAAKCLEAVELDPESYRVGHTKVQSEPLKPLAQFS